MAMSSRESKLFCNAIEIHGSHIQFRVGDTGMRAQQLMFCRGRRVDRRARSDLGLSSTFVLPVVAHSRIHINTTPIYVSHDISGDLDDASAMTLTFTWKTLPPSHLNYMGSLSSHLGLQTGG